MPIPEHAVRAIRDLPSLLRFLERDLQWKLPQNPTTEEATFEWSASELRLNEAAQSKLSGGSVLQLRPMTNDQPWGIFIINFTDGQVYKTALRQVLRGLVPRRRRDSNLPAWKHENILFICTTSNQEFTFAHFKGEKPERAKLVRFSWSPDEPIRTLCEFNLDALRMPQDTSRWTEEWQKAFDVEKVTKQFYNEIANWYFWASDHVRFPKPNGIVNPDAYKAQSLIRLITRLIFCWFVKKKGLIPYDLFDLPRLAALLKKGERLATSKDTIYYKAILQNLFFATLNQEMDKRDFRKRNKHPSGRDPHHGITNLYRYEDAFADPKAFLDLMRDIPFLNGGLFECLDKVYRAEENLPDVRIDGFSDHPKNPLSVPDFLFFGDEREVDLSAAYGEKRYRRAKVRGLIHTFSRYNFTVTENTPLDQEVALDPELAGKVFENLLAAYNPETATTARKATGSYYTPREIVDYMVDEALIASLKTKLETALPSAREVEARLRHLFAYNDEPHQFTKEEVRALIAAIDNLKALDPACGSGAFPMGLLHRLVFILGNLDPHNELWKQQQIAKASEIPDATVREKTLEDIEKAFTAGELDYGRKLYLIENCIYGVDIQPIAVQIAKMRFFISLVVEQNVLPLSDGEGSGERSNRGIRPLPNLETKFVAANTLIGIEKPSQMVLRNPQIDAKEAELRRVRERHFTARTPATKAKCRELDAKLRAEISALLQADGFPRETTEKLARWEPYDQNASADFFDREWMFGIRDGFDIVIGNPPYIFARKSVEKGLTEADKQYLYAHYELAEYQVNLYPLFIEAGTRVLLPNGVLGFITPNNWLTINTNRLLRKFVLNQSDIIIVNFYARVFESSDVDSAIIIFRNSRQNRMLRLLEYTDGFKLVKEASAEFFLKQRDHVINIEAFKGSGVAALIAKIDDLSVRLQSVADVKAGLKAYEIGCGTPPQSEEMKKNRVYHSTRQKDKTYIKYLDGKDVCRYRLGWSGEFLKWGANLAAPRKDFRLYSTKRILVRQIPAPLPYCIHACLTDEVALNDLNSMNIINFQQSPECILGILNSRLISFWFVHTFGKMQRETFPQFKVNELANFPLPKVIIEKPALQQPIIGLVDKILEAKRSHPQADTSAWEREIDQIVYLLYGLTEEEIKIVEGR
jgi:adenine-specific DNA-methyltransferase